MVLESASNSVDFVGMTWEQRQGTRMSQAYQRGSIRRVHRLRGDDVWEWRYRVRGKMKQEKFNVADYPTEKALWTHLETSVRLLNEGAAENTCRDPKVTRMRSSSTTP